MIGELPVGQLLERLRAKGYEVFHDIEGDGFNVDHVLIGRGGVFVIETKTISKRNDIRRNEVRYDGQSVLVNGFTPDRDPIAQVGANARWVHKLLEGEPP